eukprot:CAMPEP_0201657556 /NCGR_PEP_ID=MMETSP0494-20130426/764_1 /ASSEMBLY_ACC=CAM_ASM_000839 /TAXON_ID=420259 /ORGANISM="Thalassiosira gravida, Strain GMp14c1" /LENGTH=470 /DNA_ID=CAMNT_0048134421 /DNA_START=181 /DNA_END=1593 /DNA_ORIENTATION=-
MSSSISTAGKDFPLMKSPSNKIQPRLKKERMVKSAPSPTNTSRHKVIHNYHDHAHVNFPSDVDLGDAGGDDGDKRKGPRGGVTIPFPTKLHVMLSRVEDGGLSHVVSWQPHGRCFVVHEPKEFVMKVMPLYFRQSKLTSFQRQLNLYGFSRITAGKDRGGYYHELFLRHKLFLCQNMSRIRIKGTGIKGKASPETEPDFYSMSWVKPDDASMAFNRDLEGEVTTATEEENKRPEPTQRQDRGSKNKRSTSRRNAKNKYLEANFGNSSPRSASIAIDLHAVVTPDFRSKKQLSVISSFDTAADTSVRRALGNCSSWTGGKGNLADRCPPFLSLSSDSDDTDVEKPHSGDEIAFEGQHFHYLGSFAAQAPSRPFVLEPRRNASMTHCNGVASLSIPCLESGRSRSSFSMAISLREPILTPSSSSSSLNEMFQQDEALEINPDTIFSDCGFNGDWEIGGDDVDIDAEFKMLCG